MSIAFWYFWYLRFPTFLCSKTTHGELPMSEDMTFKSVPYKAERNLAKECPITENFDASAPLLKSTTLME